MTVVSVPIERSPEVWLEKVAAPLVPEVREAATKPFRRQLAKMRSKGMTDTEILVQWGMPNHEREKLSKRWPTLAELQDIAEYVWCFPPPRLGLKRGLVKQSLTGALFFTALITLLIFFVQEAFSANMWLVSCTVFAVVFIAILGSYHLFFKVLCHHLKPFWTAWLAIRTGLGLKLGLSVGLLCTTLLLDWLGLYTAAGFTLGACLASIMLDSSIAAYDYFTWRKLRCYGITPDEALQKYAAQPSKTAP